MDQSRLDELIDNFAFGNITPDEWQELMEWYRSEEIGAVEWPSEGPEERDRLQQRMLHRLQASIRAIPESPALAVTEVPVIPIEPQADLPVVPIAPPILFARNSPNGIPASHLACGGKPVHPRFHHLDSPPIPGSYQQTGIDHSQESFG